MADKAAQRFHEQLNSGDFDAICREADEVFSQGEKHDELLHFLEKVHQKLGNAGAGSRVNLHVNNRDQRNIRDLPVQYSV